MNKGNLAKEYFNSGYNCSQAVALAFAEEMNMEKDFVAMAVSGFGGGMGRMREVCGCVSGMVFVISNLYGYIDPKDNQGKKELYKKINDVANQYKELNSSIVCRELLGLTQNDGSVPEERTEEYYEKRPCSDLCQVAGDILEKFLDENIIAPNIQ
jgi:C_GCAxxG_C_C family probable redox protein